MQAVQAATVVDAVAIAVAVGTVGGGIVWAIRASSRWIWSKAIQDFGDALDQRIQHGIAAISSDVAYIKTQLELNGGSSVKDQVQRLVDSLDEKACEE